MNNRIRLLTYFKILMVVLFSAIQTGCVTNEWIGLYDGKTMKGWTPSENKSSWQIENGAFVTKGPRSHLFYTGEVLDHKFKNFEFMVDVKTLPGSNSGIYFHTEFQEEGWPAKGYECQVINSSPDVPEGSYVEHKMTGSIYAIRNVWKSPVPDNEWFNCHIVVHGKTIRTYINGEIIAEYTEPENPYRPESMNGQLISSGTFALQCHDPGSKVYFKNIKVKPLSDDISTPSKPLDDLQLESKIVQYSSGNFPLMDLHVHLKGDLTMEMALQNARKYGFTYGIAVNCGLNMTYETEAALKEFLSSYKKPSHTYLAMQAEGREWTELFSKETISQFDYVFTDAMTWTNDNGKRMRLWIKEETEIGDPQIFMDQLVNRIEKIINNEPVDIYVNATYLPIEINHLYDELWTEERMNRVIQVLTENNVAMEINDRYKIPSSIFIKRAKDAGVKFTFGTNNTKSKDLGNLTYCIEMIEECNLSPKDLWFPK